MKYYSRYLVPFGRYHWKDQSSFSQYSVEIIKRGQKIGSCITLAHLDDNNLS